MFSSGAPGVSFIDPVVIGRNVFSVTNDFVSGLAEYIQGVLSTVIDVILDTYQGTVSVMSCNFYHVSVLLHFS